MLWNRILSESICRLSPLIASDVTDEDIYRTQSLDKEQSFVTVRTSTLLGFSSFLSKFGQSIAPMVALYLIPSIPMFTNENQVKDSGISSPEEVKLTSKEYLAIWKMLNYLPLICVLVQTFMWYFYSLHGDTLKKIKSVRA
jgi:Na+/melibiose symporter-like transporter